MNLNLEADRALFETQAEALVATVHENERPLSGLAGILDWRFQGVISACIRSGAITGKAGECVFMPVVKNGRGFKLILAGAGKSTKPGERTTLPVESLRALQKNLESLKLGSVVISRKDFGNPSEEFLNKNLKNLSIRLAP